MGGTDPVDARGLAIYTDASGNVYTTGVFKGRVDFDPGPGVYFLDPFGSEDAFVLKLDSSGKFLWVKQIDLISNSTMYARGKAIAADASGNVFITGEFSQGNLSLNCFVSKLNSAGNLLWTKQLGGYANATAIKVDGVGNVYTTGLLSSQGDFDPGPGIFNLGNFGSTIFISKLDANGNFVWAKEIKGHQDTSGSVIFGGGGLTGEASIAIDGAQNIYISGSFGGKVDFDPGSPVYTLTGSGINGSQDIFVLKLGADGNFVWAKQMGGEGLDLSVSMAVDNSGNIYTIGDFDSIADFDPGPGVYNLNAGNDFSNRFVSKLDMTGNFSWAIQLPGSIYWCYSIASDNTGNIYITGYFGNTLDFDPGPGVYNLSTSGYDIFVLKLNANGNFIWAKQLGGMATIISTSIVVDPLDNVYTTGYFFGGGVDFDPGPATYYLSAGDGENIFVHKMSQCLKKTFSDITASTCRNYTLNGQTYTTSGEKIQTLTNAAGCDSVITLHLTITPPLFTTIAKSICAGQSFNGHSATGIYIDTLVANNGCDSITTLQLTVLPKPSPDLGSDTLLCTGDSLVLYPGNFAVYTWQDGSSQNRITIKRAGVYSVSVSDNCGSATDEIIIKEGICDIYFPTAFSPNNDGLNDLFKILTINNLTEYHLSVYNRWGQKVFETFDYSEGWNGVYNGQLQSSQTFVWYCEFKRQVDSNRTTKKGTVTLIR